MRKKHSRKPNYAVKRVMDILICLLGLPVALPLGFVLAILICLDGYGTPFYKQTRIGTGGAKFKLYKFRTMVLDAEERLEKYLAANPQFAREWEEKQKLRHDPRITRIGCFLRKTSLDELPQIINILKGDMTLVGPRPIVDNEKDKYGGYFNEYSAARPGLTGLWQISGRNNTTYRRRVACDHYYLNNWSVCLDIWILAKTVPTAIGGTGAW